MGYNLEILDQLIDVPDYLRFVQKQIVEELAELNELFDYRNGIVQLKLDQCRLGKLLHNLIRWIDSMGTVRSAKDIRSTQVTVSDYSVERVFRQVVFYKLKADEVLIDPELNVTNLTNVYLFGAEFDMNVYAGYMLYEFDTKIGGRIWVPKRVIYEVARNADSPVVSAIDRTLFRLHNVELDEEAHFWLSSLYRTADTNEKLYAKGIKLHDLLFDEVRWRKSIETDTGFCKNDKLKLITLVKTDFNEIEAAQEVPLARQYIEQMVKLTELNRRLAEQSIGYALYLTKVVYSIDVVAVQKLITDVMKMSDVRKRTVEARTAEQQIQRETNVNDSARKAVTDGVTNEVVKDDIKSILRDKIGAIVFKKK